METMLADQILMNPLGGEPSLDGRGDLGRERRA
jgi:hypothetical protein